MGHPQLDLGSTTAVVIDGDFWDRSDSREGTGYSWRRREFLARTPMRRFGDLEELVGVFLASEAASFVTGYLLAVDGGFLASGVNQ